MHIWKALHSFSMFVMAHNRVSFNENMNAHTMCWRIWLFHTVRVIFFCNCVKSVRFLFSGVHHAVCCVTASHFKCSTRTWCYLPELPQVGNSLATSAQPGLAPNYISCWVFENVSFEELVKSGWNDQPRTCLSDYRNDETEACTWVTWIISSHYGPVVSLQRQRVRIKCQLLLTLGSRFKCRQPSPPAPWH